MDQAEDDRAHAVTSMAPDELARVCMHNLLASPAERVYFKDLASRFLLVSEGWLAAYGSGAGPDQIVGKTDFDIFQDEHAKDAFEDEQRIIRTGEPLIGKAEREGFSDRADIWVSTTKMPLRDASGRIIGTYGISRDITGQIKAENALAFQALHDPLTGLSNRPSLMDRLSQALVSLERHPAVIAVLFVDLDNFKSINDSIGHASGDRVLLEVARRLTKLARRVDTVARIGGDEFVVLCSALQNDDDIRLIGDRVARALAAPFADDGHDLSVTCSVGIATTRDANVEPDQLIRDADVAMYEAKKAGKNRYRLHDPTRRSSGAMTHRLEVDLRRAIQDSQLFLLYQPLFTLPGRTLSGVEALVRWSHPERGIVLPDEFIPLAESCGLIGRIDSFVLDEACRQLGEWTALHGWPRDFTMSVNLSGRQLADSDLPRHVAKVLRRYGIDPPRICLEITETALIGEVGDVQPTLTALTALGVRLALDDFGTGYSTLAHLQRLRVDTLKIDRSFVEHICRSERDREIIAAITAMSHALGMSVVGEGIETSGQLEALSALSCDEAQGYLFARPMHPDEVPALARWTAAVEVS